MSTSKLASKRFSSEKSSVLTKEALQELNLHEFDILPHWEPTAGKIYTKVRAISARINQNFDGWPSEELKKAYRTFLGKPVFVNHVNDDPRKARGVVVAARFVENGDDKFIEVIQEVDADRFPKLAHELSSGGLDSVSMGAEARICKCSYCGNEASDMLSMCSHVLSKKGQILGRINDDGTRDDVLVYEECRDISFFELSYVFDPADETAVVSNVLTANKKRGYGETSLPPQVDTLRDEEEDLAGYFIEPPQEFQEPDLDQEYPALDEGTPSADRRDEERREDVQMTRVSRNRRRQTRTRQAAPHPSGIDFDAILGEGWENEHRYPQERQPSFDNWDHENYEGPGGTGRIQWEGDNDLSWENSRGESGRTRGNIWDAMQDVEDSLGHYSSNRGSKGNRMSNRRARRRFAEDLSRNDQGEQEEVFISQTPPAEPVETGEGATDAPNNTKSDRVKTDQNRSTHTNFEARRRARRRHAAPEIYKDFLEYAQGQGMDLDRMQELYDRNYESNGMDDEADLAVRDFEEMMYDFLGVNSVDEDDRLYTLMEAPGSYEINHPYNFRGASRRRRARRRSAAKNLHMLDDMQLLDGYATVSMGLEEGWGEDEGMTQEDLQDYEEELERRGIDPYNNDVYSSRRRRRRSSRRSPVRRMAEQSDDFDIDSHADIVRDVEDADVFDTPVETNPKDASRRRALRRRANGETYFVHDNGVVEVFDADAYRREHPNADIATDGYDGRMWDDSVATGWTPAPGGRSPFEYDRYSSRKRRSSRRRARRRTAEVLIDQGSGLLVEVMVDENGNETFYGLSLDGQPLTAELAAAEGITDASDSRVQRDGVFDPSDLNLVEASRKRRRARRRHANPTRMVTDDIADIMGFSAPFKDGWEVIDNPNMPSPHLFKEISDFDGVSVMPSDDGSFSWSVTRGLKNDGSGVASSAEEAMAMAEQAYGQRTSSKRRRRMADTNLDLAAPDGRVNVEAPTADTTDEEAQASQFDKKDFANNAGDNLADPDLSTDQNWAPGEGKTSSNRASQIEGMRLAEAMVEAGMKKQEDRWKLAEAYTKLPAAIVRDRISLLAQVTSAKQASRDDKSQRPVTSARKAPGLGQRPTLQKSANKSDDYSLFF